jgi:hypothetical protein
MRAGGLARRVGLDRNPMRRRTDRIEAWVTVVLALVFLIGGPLAAWLAADTVRREAVRASAGSSRDYVRVRAVLLEDTTMPYDGAARPAPVLASWTAADGTLRTGAVVLESPDTAGSVVVAWLDADGNPAPPPRPAPSPVVSAWAAGMLTTVVLVCVLSLVRATVRSRLDSRRLAEWQQEWTEVEPRWRGRL